MTFHDWTILGIASFFLVASGLEMFIFNWYDGKEWKRWNRRTSRIAFLIGIIILIFGALVR